MFSNIMWLRRYYPKQVKTTLVLSIKTTTVMLDTMFLGSWLEIYGIVELRNLDQVDQINEMELFMLQLMSDYKFSMWLWMVGTLIWIVYSTWLSVDGEEVYSAANLIKLNMNTFWWLWWLLNGHCFRLRQQLSAHMVGHFTSCHKVPQRHSIPGRSISVT